MNNKYKRFDGTGVITLSDASEKAVILETGTFSNLNRIFHAKPFLKGEELERFKQNVYQRRVFVNFVPQYLSDSDLRLKFSVFGEIEDAYLIKDGSKSGKKSKGYGFVVFKNKSSADQAIKTGFLTIGSTNVKIQPYAKRTGNKDPPAPTSKQVQLNTIPKKSNESNGIKIIAQDPKENQTPELQNSLKNESSEDLSVSNKDKGGCVYSTELALRYKGIFACNDEVHKSHLQSLGKIVIKKSIQNLNFEQFGFKAQPFISHVYLNTLNFRGGYF
jgi:RNA recognition motif-containing protein